MRGLDSDFLAPDSEDIDATVRMAGWELALISSAARPRLALLPSGARCDGTRREFEKVM